MGGNVNICIRYFLTRGLSPSQRVTDIMTNPKKVIHINPSCHIVRTDLLTSYPQFNVDKNPGLTILMCMTILHDYKTRIDCDDKYCSMRYYTPEEPLAVGIIRLNYYHKDGKVPQTVVTINSMEIATMVDMLAVQFPTYTGDQVVKMIREDVTDRVREHMTRGKL